jgi:hypothetical protein
LLDCGSHGGYICCLSGGYQDLVAAAVAVEVAAAVLVLQDHWGIPNLLIQGLLEVDLIPGAGHCRAGSYDVMGAPEDIQKVASAAPLILSSQYFMHKLLNHMTRRVCTSNITLLQTFLVCS